MARLSDQVKEGVEEDPDEIDEVPVEPAELERGIPACREITARGAAGEPAEQPEADDDVERVQPGHEVIERVEQARSRESYPGVVEVAGQGAVGDVDSV